jgi:chromosome segregation ATPase
MPPALGRRSRSTFDSDEESQSTREATPISTAPNDAKRARRRLLAEDTDEDDNNDTSAVSPERSLRRNPSNDIPSSAQRPRRAISDDDDEDIEADEDEEVEDNDRHTLSKAPSSGISMHRRSDPDGPRSKRKHQPGAIVRVKVTNFVTYTSAEFFPGPNLNMVIGPNGTGKSSLVCAICLGLGWGPQHLGRAKEVSEFIKNGCREASIEIELQKAETGPHSRRNPVFTRHMKREGNKSTWMINGTASNNKQVITLARSFSVQIDNLCQFLPQDKVVEFAQMNPMALLESTQRAVAPELLEHHKNLIKIRDKQKEVISSRKHDKEQLKNLENRQEGQRLEVENTRRRAEITQRLEWLEKCRPITLYNDARKKSREAKLLQQELTQDLKQLEKEVAPTLRRVNEKEKYEKATLALKKHREQELTNGEKACEDLESKIAACDEAMNEYETNEKMEKANLAPQRQKRLDYKRQIQDLIQQMDEVPEPFDPAAINEQIRSKTIQKREIETATNENKTRIRDAQAQGDENNKAVAKLKERLQAFDTQDGQQLNRLERASSDTWKAWNWIQEHQDEFQKPVFGPPMVTCSLKDLRMARVIESMFQQSDFKVITVQCQEDFTTCQRKLIGENKWSDISIRVCSTTSLDQFRPPMPLEKLHELGLDGWAIDFIEGPPTVMAMLCNERSLHQNGVGRREINNTQYQAIVKTGMKSFVAGGTSYRLTHRAEYGEAGKATSARPTRQPQVWTDQPVDGGLKAQVQRQINEMKSDNADFMQLINELKKAVMGGKEPYMKLNKEIEELKNDKEARQMAQVKFAGLPQEKAQAEEKLKDVEDLMAGFRQRMSSLLLQKDQKVLEKAELAVTYAAAVSRLRTINQDLLEAELMHIEALSDYQTLKARNEDIHNLLTTRRLEERHAEQLAKEKTEAARILVKQVQELRKEGDKLSDQGNPGLAELFQEIAAKHATPEGYHPDDLEADIDTIKADLELVQGGDQRVIDEFEKRANMIGQLRERLAATKAKDVAMASLIRETRELWETRLDELIGVISDQFGENFRRIGCAGSVVVFKANAPVEEVEEMADAEDGDENEPQNQKNADGNGLDFANWALHISVKFREAEPLSLLDSHRQSGGERAVSTIFYLMALQSLSRAPFRVVDEINQGMDPRNERMVHGRMVDIAAGGNGSSEPGGSQYFLVTPKLLGGLKYRPGMTVLCIVSGENMPGGERRVDFRRLIGRARELGLSGRVGAGARRIDSGVAMGSSLETDDMYGDGNGNEVRMNGAMGGQRLTSVGA